MAENKKSFILYCDFKEVFNELSDQDAGQLIKHIFQYVNDENPVTENPIVKISFIPIKNQLKRDLKEWEDTRHERSEAGRVGGLRSGETRRKQAEAKRSTASKNEANEAVTDNVNVTVNAKERENTGIAPEILKSNLFRQPVIPTKNQVLKAILDAGGTKEMAKSFWLKHEAAGWFINGSPVVSYSALAQRFVSNWKAKDENDNNSSAPPLQILR